MNQSQQIIKSLREGATVPPGTAIALEDTAIDTWFERDRAYVILSIADEDGGPDNNQTIIEWWDEAVQEAVEDGFLDPRDWHQSAYKYAVSVGAIKQAA